ncbi:MAG: diacylglycerol kinase family protein [Clostridia bacterium]|nr:diacylglycerol kinase family protein [Clostridia bacterium]
MKYILYNKLANNNNGIKAALQLNDKIREVVLEIPKEGKLIPVDEISYTEFLSDKTAEDEIYLVGGDGTLNRFVNDVYGMTFAPKIYFYPAGSGNDFFNDQKDKIVDGVIELNDYLSNLPTVYVNGIEKRFINGIGFGLDGVVCEIGDDIRAKSDKKINYTMIALKLCLYAYKPRKATVIVDGERHEFENVWIAPAMKGRFYGGGMMVAPKQDRFFDDGKLTLVIASSKSRLKLLVNFPKLFKGNVDKVKIVHTFTGKTITVEYDEPTALQIDGDTVRNVKTYTVKA